MKIKDHPLKQYGYIKDFDTLTISRFVGLSDVQKEYEIIDVLYKTICGVKEKVFVIASPETMKQWNLKPKRYRFSAMEAIYKVGEQ